MKLENKRVLLTGGWGFLGQWVNKELDAKNAIVFRPQHSAYDLRDRKHIKRAFDAFKPEVVVHLAASVGGIQANYENPGKFFYDNMVMGAELMEEARIRRVDKFVQVGTSCSYPADAPSRPVRETDLWSGAPNEITGAYGVAKLALITMATAYRQQYGLDAITLIPVNLYGPGDSFDPRSSHVIPALILKALEAKKTFTPMTVWGTGNATREFLHVQDAARGIVEATEKYASPAPVNLGTGVETTIKEIAFKVAETVKFNGPIEFDSTKPEGQQRRVFDVSRAKEEFGFEASTPLTWGIQDTVDWYLNEKFNRNR